MRILKFKCCESGNNFKYNNVILFTGLFDKTGKEIWEEDILKYTYSDDNYALFRIYLDKLSLNKELWDMRGKPFRMEIMLSVIEQCEVVGNSFENKELDNRKNMPVSFSEHSYFYKDNDGHFVAEKEIRRG